jgi:flotillin
MINLILRILQVMLVAIPLGILATVLRSQVLRAATRAETPSSNFVAPVWGVPLLLVLTLVCLTIFAFKAWYLKATAERAFVRTGVGGTRVVIGESRFVFPLLHHVTWVSLRLTDITIGRTGVDAFRTLDGLRCETRATFLVHVPAQWDQIYRAAQLFGPDGGVDKGYQNAFLILAPVFEEALRAVVERTTLEVLVGDRLKFAEAVKIEAEAQLYKYHLTIDQVILES